MLFVYDRLSDDESFGPAHAGERCDIAVDVPRILDISIMVTGIGIKSRPAEFTAILQQIHSNGSGTGNGHEWAKGARGCAKTE